MVSVLFARALDIPVVFQLLPKGGQVPVPRQHLRPLGDGQAGQLAQRVLHLAGAAAGQVGAADAARKEGVAGEQIAAAQQADAAGGVAGGVPDGELHLDRKSTRLNSSHVSISYAVFCLKKKKTIRK